MGRVNELKHCGKGTAADGTQGTEQSVPPGRAPHSPAQATEQELQAVSPGPGRARQKP